MALTPAILRNAARRGDGPSTAYYREHPEAAAKKSRHQAVINRRPEERKRRAQLNRERRRRGIYGEGGPDVSHTASGGTVLEAPSENRARNGAGGRPRLKADSVWAVGFAAAPRTDAPEAGKGKPCGESHIPKDHKCSKGTGVLTSRNLSTVAKIALSAGLLAGGVAIARKWNAADDQKFAEATKAGKTWDVYEQKRQEDATDPEVAELRAQRQARRDRFCGRTDSGKTTAGRSDGFRACSRQIGEQSAYGQLLVHPDGQRVFKVPTGSANAHISTQEAIEASRNEYQILVEAKQVGVNVPSPISINPKTGVLQMQYIPNSTTLRSFNKANTSLLAAREVSDNLLNEMQRMHRAGIVHNDLHPGNILVAPNNRVAIIDFGLASTLRNSDKAEVMDSIYDELATVVRRATFVNKFPVAAVELQNWISLRNSYLLKGLHQGNLSTKQLESGIDMFYRDLRDALQYKRRNPTKVLRLNTVI